MKTILVTGGAGYIGSHTLRVLKTQGYLPVCFDNLSTGFREFAETFPFIKGDLGNPADLEQAFSNGKIDAVIHFASHALVEESCRNPYKYYHDNVLNCLNLLQAMVRYQTKFLVFSSSCAVYGRPLHVPMGESSPLQPINPYGATKMMVERILADYEKAHGIRHVALRYFNAAGAIPDGTIGEWHNPETHLIPRLFEAALGRINGAEIYGNDYPTPDGTCIRDYIHVMDLALAHVAALQHLSTRGSSDVFNLGTGRGNSVLEVVREVMRSTGKEFAVHFKSRRAGDPPSLVADPGKAKSVLGWSAQYSTIQEIVETAWNWHQKRPLSNLRQI
jgi:UDP-glucose-4-epimerase GalE